MNWKQAAAGAGGVLAVAAVGGLLGGRRGFEAGAVIGAIGAMATNAVNPNYPTASAIGSATGLATAVAAWGSTPRGKRGFASAMETAKSLSR